MKFYFVFICVFFLSTDFSINCFKPTDFCIKKSIVQKCKAYECGSKFCSINKKFCQNLILWDNLVAMNHKEPKLYKRFIYDMNDCAKRDLRNKWSREGKKEKAY
jgi:hypothetical protein